MGVGGAESGQQADGRRTSQQMLAGFFMMQKLMKVPKVLGSSGQGTDTGNPSGQVTEQGNQSGHAGAQGDPFGQDTNQVGSSGQSTEQGDTSDQAGAQEGYSSGQAAAPGTQAETDSDIKAKKRKKKAERVPDKEKAAIVLSLAEEIMQMCDMICSNRELSINEITTFTKGTPHEGFSEWLLENKHQR